MILMNLFSSLTMRMWKNIDVFSRMYVLKNVSHDKIFYFNDKIFYFILNIFLDFLCKTQFPGNFLSVSENSSFHKIQLDYFKVMFSLSEFNWTLLSTISFHNF